MARGIESYLFGLDVNDGCVTEAFAEGDGDEPLIGAICVLEEGGAADAAIRGCCGAEESVLAGAGF